MLSFSPHSCTWHDLALSFSHLRDQPSHLRTRVLSRELVSLHVIGSRKWPRGHTHRETFPSHTHISLFTGPTPAPPPKFGSAERIQKTGSPFRRFAAYFKVWVLDVTHKSRANLDSLKPRDMRSWLQGRCYCGQYMYVRTRIRMFQLLRKPSVVTNGRSRLWFKFCVRAYSLSGRPGGG